MDPDGIAVAAAAGGTEECSDCSRRRTPTLASEALTAKQQVALWLTRASVSDLSAMSSLKSLVFPASIARNATATDRSSAIKRNHSTKSLAVAWPKDDPVPEEAIRKCETVIALTNLSGGQTEGNMSSETSKSTQSLFRKIMPQQRCPAEVGLEGEAVVAPQSANASEAADVRAQRNNADDGIAMSGYATPIRGLRPVNRLRSTSSVLCSQCISVISEYNSRMTSRTASQRSLLRIASVSSMRRTADAGETLCKICLLELPSNLMMKLQLCGCVFCLECMAQYIAVEVMSGAYDISCPDAECEKKGTLLISEMEELVGKELMDKHRNYRLNTEVALDSNRAWCPEVGCGAICHVCVPEDADAQRKAKSGGVVVNCPSCAKEFCSRCSSKWHPGRTCEEHGKEIVSRGRGGGGGGGAAALSQGLAPLLAEDAGDNIKPCPMCNVLIERDDGCAQMMCKRCKHVFCWHCGTSLDDDFLLRHYDSGRCKGMLGHSRVSVLWHRAQVIGIFAGFGIMLVVASPLLLLAAPCILCCRCKVFQRFNTADSTADATNATATPMAD